MTVRDQLKRWGWVMTLFAAFVSSTAHADERSVVKRLKTYGDLSEPDARTVMDAVGQRMRLAADLSASGDPLRVAVSTALYDSATPADQAATSMVRLRLYAGLTEWALDHVFSSRRAVTEICSQSGMDATQCRALLAAGQNVPFEDISPLRLKAAVARQESSQDSSSESGASAGATAANVHWPRRGGETQAEPGIAANVHWPRRAAEPQADTRRARPAAPAAESSRAAAPPRVQPPSKAEIAQRKADYAAQRQAYLERRQQEMEARKAKLLATAGGERVQRGPASDEEAEVAGLGKQGGAKSGQAAMVASRATPASKRPSNEKSSDGDLFEGLMDNPLGKQ